MATKYPPYVNGYGSIPKLFRAIQDASVPPKVTHNFLQTTLGLKSSTYRAMLPLLKRLGFIDQANVPTQAYKDYRDPGQARAVLADRLRDAYSDLYAASETAHSLSKDALMSKLRTVTGAAASDKTLPLVAGTFLELVKLSDFDLKAKKPVKTKEEDSTKGTDMHDAPPPQRRESATLGISYTINLNLPATTEIEVFNAIFKSLREHILDER